MQESYKNFLIQLIVLTGMTLLLNEIFIKLYFNKRVVLGMTGYAAYILSSLFFLALIKLVFESSAKIFIRLIGLQKGLLSSVLYFKIACSIPPIAFLFAVNEGVTKSVFFIAAFLWIPCALVSYFLFEKRQSTGE